MKLQVEKGKVSWRSIKLIGKYHEELNDIQSVGHSSQEAIGAKALMLTSQAHL